MKERLRGILADAWATFATFVTILVLEFAGLYWLEWYLAATYPPGDLAMIVVVLAALLINGTLGVAIWLAATSPRKPAGQAPPRPWQVTIPTSSVPGTPTEAPLRPGWAREEMPGDDELELP